jgi:hypothetical protein
MYLVWIPVDGTGSILISRNKLIYSSCSIYTGIGMVTKFFCLCFLHNTVIQKVCLEEETKGKFPQNLDYHLTRSKREFCSNFETSLK